MSAGATAPEPGPPGLCPPAAKAAEPLRRVRRSALVWNVSKYSVLWLSRLYFRLRIEGSERLPASGPVLVVANHASYLDPPMIGISARRWVGFLAQAGLARLRPMRWWLAQVGVTLIDRTAPSKEAMRIIADCLRAGEVVGLFPEGTRSADGTVAPFRTGVEFLVRRTGAPVLPVGIDGAHRAFPRGAWLPRPHRIVVRYGEPWPAVRVLAPGGIEALRAEIATLARCPLRPMDDGRSQTPSPSSAGGAT
ncbi:MAG: 1-acyl-sn-glycerol-3-phosphate acyltransferase [Planctomycetes bacterium]|nr:1-acyl-sn-glycerol-3-phosphate acyltransferase [Planctomycetota bacterium]